ncbi:hypothetical protein BGZ83_008865 [Gryganskiella cystojenkinii]|nr:hypothetical protein BGZ83_008865 [Gryganskiella cystojenkinii]
MNSMSNISINDPKFSPAASSASASTTAAYRDNQLHEMDQQLCTLAELLSEVVMVPFNSTRQPQHHQHHLHYSCQQCQQRQYQQQAYHQQHEELEPQQQVEATTVNPSIFESTGYLFLFDQDPRACIQNLREERRRVQEKKTALELEWTRQSIAVVHSLAEDRRIQSMQAFSDAISTTTQSLIPSWQKRSKALEDLESKMNQIQYLIRTILIQGTRDGDALTEGLNATDQDKTSIYGMDTTENQDDVLTTGNGADGEHGGETSSIKIAARTVRWQENVQEVEEKGDHNFAKGDDQSPAGKCLRTSLLSTASRHSELCSRSQSSGATQTMTIVNVADNNDHGVSKIETDTAVVVVDMITFLCHASPELYDPNPDRCLALLRAEHTRLKVKRDALELESERQQTLIMQLQLQHQQFFELHRSPPLL